MEDNAVLVPVVTRVLIHVMRTAFRAFSILHGNLLHEIKRTRLAMVRHSRFDVRFSGRCLVIIYKQSSDFSRHYHLVA